MTLIFLCAALVCATILSVIMALGRAGSAARQLPASFDWIDEVSADRYRPMLRLLRRDDLHFLRDQPGYDRGMEAKLRVQRARIFAQYLSHLQEDFRCICAALKLLMIQAEHDRPDLAAVVLRSQFDFT